MLVTDNDDFGLSLCDTFCFTFWLSDWEPTDANPVLFTGRATSPNSASLTWVPREDYYCDVLGYKIVYNDPIFTVAVDVLGADSTSLEIEGLRDGANYTFRIAAFTWERVLPYESSVQVDTPSLSSKLFFCNVLF